MHVVMGLVGILSLIIIAVLFSSNRKAINLRTVCGAFAIQALIPAIVIFTDSGASILGSVSTGVQTVINSANAVRVNTILAISIPSNLLLLLPILYSKQNKIDRIFL